MCIRMYVCTVGVVQATVCRCGSVTVCTYVGVVQVTVCT